MPYGIPEGGLAIPWRYDLVLSSLSHSRITGNQAPEPELCLEPGESGLPSSPRHIAPLLQVERDELRMSCRIIAEHDGVGWKYVLMLDADTLAWTQIPHG